MYIYQEFNNVLENTNEVEIDHHIYQVFESKDLQFLKDIIFHCVYLILYFFVNLQCFGGYWGGITNNQEGFKTHLDYSCEQMVFFFGYFE